MVEFELKKLSDIERQEILKLREIVVNLAGVEVFGIQGWRCMTSTYKGESFHWCLERMDQITGFIEPKFVDSPGGEVLMRDL